MAGEHGGATSALPVTMGAKERRVHRTFRQQSSMECLMECTVAAIGAKPATGVPPHARLRRALNFALGHSHGGNRALGEWPGPVGVDGRRRRRRGTPSDPEKNR